ncbi:thermonuclease family protein [Ancylobacter mangrovi]|uniref:thermonuclease family protein n=1 Tax=Ancylobacter mangrovi TaxID=2972472 RepID=UPI0021631AFE|nr:nuclease [Ancylobacter mangrovi]MCS0504834.1 nuclease [Ancylobacter mangrovi]
MRSGSTQHEMRPSASYCSPLTSACDRAAASLIPLRHAVAAMPGRLRTAALPCVVLFSFLVPASAAPVGGTSCPAAYGAPVRVSGVNDFGDLLLADGRTLRLAALVVASGEPSARAEFRAMLIREAAGREIEIASASPAPDRYGRLVGLARLPGHDDAGAAGLQRRALGEGVAVALPEPGYLGCMAALLEAEGPARVARRGLWRNLPIDARDKDALRAQAGHFTILEGRVAGVGNGRAVDYLNFGRVWRQDATLRMTHDSRAALEDTGVAVGDLAGRVVMARGVVFEAGGPAIDIRWAEQVELRPRVTDEQAGNW